MKDFRRVGVVSLFASFAACTVGEEPRVVSADEPLPDDVVAGDVVRRGDVELVVPEPGEEVLMIADFEDGTSIELAIRNPLGGAVEIIEPTMEEPDSLVIAASAPAACDDGAFSLSGHKWTSQFQWKFQSGSTPSSNSVANVEAALKNAAAAITTSRNNCGLADLVAATQSYKGRTTAAPAVHSQNGVVTCGGTDGNNVVGFGSLPAGTLGVACSWTSGGAATEGDIKLSTRNAWYALGVPSGCSNRFGVQAIGAHEFGHVFGLGHVSESTHPNLTMSTAARACSNAPLTLGRGDVRGLRQLY
jgi:hypothetical protein